MSAITLPTPVIPVFTHNLHLYALYNMYRQYRYQFAFSTQSANGSSGMDTNDIVRWEGYVIALEAQIANIKSFPNMDVVEYERKFNYEPLEELPAIENNDLIKFLALIDNAILTIVNSGQSAKNMFSMHPADMGRIEADLAVLKSYVEDYIKTATPVDLTATTPSTVSVGPGRQDV